MWPLHRSASPFQRLAPPPMPTLTSHPAPSSNKCVTLYMMFLRAFFIVNAPRTSMLPQTLTLSLRHRLTNQEMTHNLSQTFKTWSMMYMLVISPCFICLLSMCHGLVRRVYPHRSMRATLPPSSIGFMHACQIIFESTGSCNLTTRNVYIRSL